MSQRGKNSSYGNEFNMDWGKRRVYDRTTGESYVTWGPDNSERAISLRKKIFKC